VLRKAGDDAKSLVLEQLRIYERLCQKKDIDLTLLEMRPGIAIFKASGNTGVFREESGGHRWQRVPPNERSGRVHTSTVTVAVLPVPTPQEFKLNESDLEILACRGSGPGGQNRNKTSTAIQMRHKPSGLVVRSEGERSQFQNKQLAFEIMAFPVIGN